VNSPGSFPGASVTRAPNGTLLKIVNPFVNVGTLVTDGIDFGASYVTKEYNWGKLDLEVNASYIYNFSVKTLTEVVNGKPQFQIFRSDDQYRAGSGQAGSGPDFKLVASAFWSKTVFGLDTLRTGFVLNYLDSESERVSDGFNK
jgi:hypothetical protein